MGTNVDKIDEFSEACVVNKNEKLEGTLCVHGTEAGQYHWKEGYG